MISGFHLPVYRQQAIFADKSLHDGIEVASPDTFTGRIGPYLAGCTR